MSDWDGYWYGPLQGTRVRLLVRGILALLVLDCLLLMLGHASRYGADGFNVAHFGWLNAILPAPSAGLYVGILLLTAILAAVLFMGGAGRGGYLLLLALYTTSWSMSMLDSYQHHYFLTIVLFCISLLPRRALGTTLRPEDPADSGDGSVSAWGYVLLAWSIAILYAFAAVAKLEPLWSNGHVLRTIVGAPAARRIGAIAAGLHLEPDAVWSAAAIAVIPMELLLAVCYVVAVRQDDHPRVRPWGRLGAVLALALHGGAELLDLRIGWFSYYMLLLGAVFFLPATWLTALERAGRAPARLARRSIGAGARLRALQPFATVAIAVSVVVLYLLLGRWMDLPGAAPAFLVAGTLMATLAVTASVAGRGEEGARRLRAALGTALAIWLLLEAGQSRYDFYRYLGGDLRRRGTPEAALAAYRKAERYAPTGRSRQPQIEAIERELRAGGAAQERESPTETSAPPTSR